MLFDHNSLATLHSHYHHNLSPPPPPPPPPPVPLSIQCGIESPSQLPIFTEEVVNAVRLSFAVAVATLLDGALDAMEPGQTEDDFVFSQQQFLKVCWESCCCCCCCCFGDGDDDDAVVPVQSRRW